MIVVTQNTSISHMEMSNVAAIKTLTVIMNNSKHKVIQFTLITHLIFVKLAYHPPKTHADYNDCCIKH